ncbi:MAG: AAC(3) family N-acetyltransferase [Clostridia bacterium]|nr:AAC(3) family N-acetyltransferase [Clostridia bacterium]
MNTFDSILRDIKNIGIKENDKIIIHSSMKNVGPTEGGGDTVLDAFCDYLGEEGLVVLPCHTWQSVKEYGNVYDVNVPSNLGLLPNLFRVREGVYRSLHPTHSMCAFGKGAKEFVDGEIGNDCFCGNGRCMNKLLDMGAKVLLLGVTLTSCTFFHLIEEQTTLDHYWFNDKPDFYKIRLDNGEIIDNPVYDTKIDTSKYFDNALSIVKNEKTTRVGKIGEAECILFECQKIYPLIQNLIRQNPDVFMGNKKINQ